MARRRATLRLISALLTICYAGVATNFAFFALDWVAPMTKTVFRPDFPCAGHDCGCKTAEQCQTQCCCFPKVAQKPACPSCTSHESDGPITVRVTYLSAARCSGQISGDDHTGMKKIDWHLPPVASLTIPQQIPEKVAFPEDDIPLDVFAVPPDKVPI
jgi:hypothetical protein